MAGAVLNALNVRLDANTIGFILNHGEAKALITDRAFADTIAKALESVERDILVIDIDDARRPKRAASPWGRAWASSTTRALLGEGDPAEHGRWPDDEWNAISLNYTSGTTGNPEGRGLSPPRRLLERFGQRARLGHGAPSGLSLDPAHVPLQRLVLSLDGDGAGRHPCLPAPGRGRGDLSGDRRSRRHPPLRRADRHADDPGRGTGRARGLRPAGQDDDRGRPAAGHGAGADGRGRASRSPMSTA